MDKVSMSYLISFSDIKQNVLWSTYLDNWWCHKLFLDQPLKQWLTGRKKGEDQNTKTWITQE